MFKIAKSLFAIVAVAAIAAGSTGAYFTDQVTSSGNTISSGTLSLTVNGSHDPGAVFSVSNVYPGGPTGYSPQFDGGGVTLKNTGSINGHAWFEIKNIIVTGGDGSLKDRIHPIVSLNQAPWGTIYTPGGVPGVSLSSLDSVHIDVANLAPDQTLDISETNIWPDAGATLDNAAQGQSLTFDVIFHLDQI